MDPDPPEQAATEQSAPEQSVAEGRTRDRISTKVAIGIGLALAVGVAFLLAGGGDNDGALNCEELDGLHVEAAAALAQRVRAVQESAPPGETGEQQKARLSADPQIAAAQEKVQEYIRAQEGCTRD
jgi:hypothetical protein